MSSIEWTGRTWNPTIGCTPVSSGCLNCYAAKEAYRFRFNPNAKDYHDLTHNGDSIVIAEHRGGDGGKRAVFTGDVRLLPERLDVPLKRKKPTRWFVDSMSDLFHERVPDDFIDRVFAVMALCPQHTFQILTKRPERMAEYLAGSRAGVGLMQQALAMGRVVWSMRWPLQNVWLGTSVEDQHSADVRIPSLLRCPAEVRFLSCEPLLEAVDLSRYLCLDWSDTAGGWIRSPAWYTPSGGLLRWVIAGGESGPNARACDPDWIRQVVAQCRAAGVAAFVKQLGAKPVGLSLSDRKGGDIFEWPKDLRVQRMPTHVAGLGKARAA